MIYCLVAIFAGVTAPYGEREIVGAEYEPWGQEFLLGTDNLGRDMLSRIIYGAQNTIGIALVTTLVAFAIGISAGFMASTLGGWIDIVLSRVVDILMAIPSLVFALMLLTIFGTSIPTLILVIAVLDSTRDRGLGLHGAR